MLPPSEEGDGEPVRHDRTATEVVAGEEHPATATSRTRVRRPPRGRGGRIVDLPRALRPHRCAAIASPWYPIASAFGNARRAPGRSGSPRRGRAGSRRGGAPDHRRLVVLVGDAAGERKGKLDQPFAKGFVAPQVDVDQPDRALVHRVAGPGRSVARLTGRRPRVGAPRRRSAALPFRGSRGNLDSRRFATTHGIAVDVRVAVVPVVVERDRRRGVGFDDGASLAVAESISNGFVSLRHEWIPRESVGRR